MPLSLFVLAGLAYKPWTESTAGWFGLREKHYWLAYKPSQIQAVTGYRTGQLSPCLVPTPKIYTLSHRMY